MLRANDSPLGSLSKLHHTNQQGASRERPPARPCFQRSFDINVREGDLRNRLSFTYANNE